MNGATYSLQCNGKALSLPLKTMVLELTNVTPHTEGFIKPLYGVRSSRVRVSCVGTKLSSWKGPVNVLTQKERYHSKQ